VEPAVAFDGNTGYTFVSATPRGDIVLLSQEDTTLGMSTLSWVDRRGTDQNAIKVPARYVDVAMAPSGRMLAAEIADPARGVNDIWVIDLEREVATRLTQGRDYSRRPVWHPDGRRIAFTSEESGSNQPYVVMADRSSPPARLAETGHQDAIAAFAPDGEWLVLERTDQRSEIWARSLRDGREVPLCQRSGGGCREPAVSPDGRLLAYVADDSGRPEVYARPFMSEGGQVQVSAAGGRMPRWRSDSHELVYRDLEGWATAVPISSGPELRAGTAQRLMVQAIDSPFVPAPDHSRFITTNSGQRGATMARLLLDWR
jgi:Tol biopolymer transport system component